MSTNLKTGVKQHLENFELAPEQLDQLLMQQQIAQAQPSRPRWIMPLSIAASLAGILFSALLLLNLSDKQQAPQIIAQIADEVALNHLRKRPLEIQTQQMAQLQNYFSELDFLPTGSSTFNGITNAKLGGGG